MSDVIHEGGCLCGKLRYSVTGDPIAVVVCHCGQCQKQSSSAFGMTMLVKRSAFKWLAGEPRAVDMVADSGNAKRGLFCGDCGSRIRNESDTRPDTYNVKPGTLDDRSWFEPIVHVWTSTKQPWTVIPEGVATFEKNPE